MHRKNSAFRWSMALAIFVVTLLCASLAGAQTFQVIHNFGGSGDGDAPLSPLSFDSNGNLYGTTIQGPPSVVCPDYGCGVVFQLTPNPDGSWSENVLYRFDSSSSICGTCMYRSFDYAPAGPVAFDSRGNLYGAATGGGISGYGTAFELTQGANGSWSRSILHDFANGPDGGSPLGLVYSQGHLYGGTLQGGAYGSGVVFDLSQTSNGHWYELIVHAFGHLNDGTPYGWLTFDANNNIYGTTASGGAHGFGTVFRLTPRPSGSSWIYTDLYDFTGGSDGAQPNGFVIFDAAGNLYGTATTGAITGGACGSNGCGTVFELTPNSNGSWSERTLYAFQGLPNDGQNPNGGVTFDAAGNLYGATANGGSSGAGTLFKLTQSGGQWKETWLHQFDLFSDGGAPIGGLLLDTAGNLYGVAQIGGPNYGFEPGGTAFEITP